MSPSLAVSPSSRMGHSPVSNLPFSGSYALTEATVTGDFGFDGKRRSEADRKQEHRIRRQTTERDRMTAQAMMASTSTEDDPRWPRILARDATADGQFWYSVATTGVYCRPSCPSRRANPTNVMIHDT